MAEIVVRDRVVTTAGNGPLKLANVRDGGAKQLELNLARVLQTNALAVPIRGPILMRLVQRELALVLSMFHHTPPGTPLTRHPAYDSASHHIRRFISEVLALGVLTAAMEDASGPGRVVHFDALPGYLRNVYPKLGVRPDLRFTHGHGILAGESRGRSQSGPTTVLATASQLRRMSQLIAWSQLPVCDPVCMAWSWIRQSGVTVDYFHVAGRPPRFRPDKSLTDDMSRVVRIVRGARGPEFTPDLSDRQDESDDAAAEAFEAAKYEVLRAGVSTREDELLATAPQIRVPGLEREWRGEWLEIQPFADSRPVRLLLAAAPLRQERRSTASGLARKAELSREFALEVSATDRILLAIDWASRPSTEVGPLIEDMLGTELS